MRTDLLIQHGAGRPKKVTPMEVECPADNAAPTSVPDPKLLVIRDAAIKDLISKIESILPDVAGASQDLSTLRRLLEEELADAAALGSKWATANSAAGAANRGCCLRLPGKSSHSTSLLNTFFTSMTWKSSGEPWFDEDLRPDPREHYGEHGTVQDS